MCNCRFWPRFTSHTPRCSSGSARNWRPLPASSARRPCSPLACSSARLANAAAGMIQFYGLPAPLRDFIVELHRDPLHNGAYGNIAQPNLYANYLALGGTALLFLWQRSSLRTALRAGGRHIARLGLRPVRLTRRVAVCAVVRACSARSPGASRTATTCDACNSPPTAWRACCWSHNWPYPGSTTRCISAPRTRVRSSAQWSYRVRMLSRVGRLWRVAWRIFTNAPVAGAGIGEFAGAAFSSGLPPDLNPI